MTTPRILAALMGTGIVLASIAGFWRRRTQRFKALFWLAIGGAMVFAAFRPHLIEYLGPDTPELRLRLMVALLSFIVLTITLESIRVARMQERYAFLWLATGALLLVGAVFAELAEVVTRATGMPYTLIVMMVLFAFMVLMLFSISLALSRLQAKLAEVARALALTEARLRRVEGDQARNAELTAREEPGEADANRPPGKRPIRETVPAEPAPEPQKRTARS